MKNSSRRRLMHLKLQDNSLLKDKIP